MSAAAKTIIPALCLLLIANVFQYRYLASIGDGENRILVEKIPAEIDLWTSRDKSFEGDRIYEFIGADTTILRDYYGASTPITFYLGYYPEVREGKRPHAAKSCYTGQGWDIKTDEFITIRDSAGDDFSVNRMTIKQGSHRQLVYYWFQNESTAYTSEIRTNLALFRNKILFRKGDIAFIRISMPVQTDEETTDKDLTRFVSMIKPFIDQAMGAALTSKGR